MYKQFCRIFPVFRACKTMFSVMFVCVLGLAFGTILAGYADNGLLSFVHNAAGSKVTIIGLAITTLLPFLLSFLFVYLGYPKFLFLVCFLYSLRLSFVSMACYGVFGAGGWLVRLLLQFSDLVLYPLFCWFVLRNISGKGGGKGTDVIPCLLSFLVIAGIDCCFVSPYLAMLIDI